MTESKTTSDAESNRFDIHLLDVGIDDCGDAALCQFGDISILIDGAHPTDYKGREGHLSIPRQLEKLLGQPQQPYQVSLLIVTHTHQDHIGCLPYLVENDILHAEWALVADPHLGWGRDLHGAIDTQVEADPIYSQPRVRKLAAALREDVEVLPESDSADAFADALLEFETDAINLENRYEGMLGTLEERGTRVVRYGRDDCSALIEAFKDVGLKILGPSEEQLRLCAEEIYARSQKALERAAALVRRDGETDSAGLYLSLTDGDDDAADAATRPGPAINLQSIVTSFEYNGHKILFTGDMQFAKPEVKTLESHIHTLRRDVENEGPYSFVKIAHHGSYNAFNEEILDELGTKYFGISAGAKSRFHPNPQVLATLNQRAGTVQWARTDLNALSTFTILDGEPRLRPSVGSLNDPTPKIKVTAYEPITTRSPSQPGPVLTEPLRIAGGRQLPNLFFVTSQQALADNIGRAETAHLLKTLRSSNILLYEDLPPNLSDSEEAMRWVQPELQRRPQAEGIVLLGGYDVVPAQRLDVTTPTLRLRLNALEYNEEEALDDFTVWSDDVYGGRALPVSRIPDGKKAGLVFSAIQANSESLGVERIGVRNVHRPFAEAIYESLPGNEEMLVSEPTLSSAKGGTYSVLGDRTYLMLHGRHGDSTRFWGGYSDDPYGIRGVWPEAFDSGNMPRRCGSVVFTACCWGALVVDKRAKDVVPNQPLAQKTTEESIALSFLERGTRAFIGCTGAHYSSTTNSPSLIYGGPMHAAFWSSYNAGAAPAKALFEAKREYLRGMPHLRGSGVTERASVINEAVERKTLFQFTCLGLGW